MKLIHCVVAVMLSYAPLPHASAAQAPAVNPDAKVLQDFNARVGAYVALQKKLERELPAQKPTKDLALIKASQEALAGESGRPGPMPVKATSSRLTLPRSSGG